MHDNAQLYSATSAPGLAFASSSLRELSRAPSVAWTGTRDRQTTLRQPPFGSGRRFLFGDISSRNEPSDPRHAGRDGSRPCRTEGSPSLADSGLEGVEWLEVRGDLVGDLDPAGLRFFPGKLLYTLRSRVEGGASRARPERANGD